tara:strand:- start:31340 stop:32854 length:1515 start_codon:yes stop_codon:yes gene_type:complete
MAEACSILVLFGATGDLTKRKLLPALYNLERQQQLQDKLSIVCVAKDETLLEDFRKYSRESIKTYSKIKIDEKILSKFIKRINYYQLRFEEEEKYLTLRSLIEKITGNKYEDCNNMFYLAAPPEYFGTIAENLKKSNMVVKNKKKGIPTKVVFEKPFGSDLDSARKLNKLITKVFDEDQIFRIDHYLAKELVQNIMVLRYANTIFEHLWNNKHIDHVQITVAETLGVEKRSAYYDKSGALRDIIQNHMMQLMALIAMESPADLTADGIRDEKVKLLKSVKHFSEREVDKHSVRAQYSGGKINDQPVPAYIDEPKVDKKSITDTFVALKLHIENGRWSGVPFYVRTGKRLKEQTTEITIVFKTLPMTFFKDHTTEPNALIIRVQPYEGISLEFNGKVPGKKLSIEPVSMDFCHQCKFGPNTPEAYERLLFDVIVGDQTLFSRWDEVEESWKICEPFLKAWAKNKAPLYKYESGSWGPKESEELLKKENRAWKVPTKPLYSEWLNQ